MRTIVVYEYGDGPRVEVGRAWVDSNGVAVVRGFMDAVRQGYESQGVYLRENAETGDAEFVTLAEGNRFLDVLLWEHRGSRIRADEVDEP